MHIGKRVLLCGIVTILVMIVAGCVSKEVLQTRKIPINHIDLQDARDGEYQGDFTYGSYTYVVNVVVQDHRIVAIQILKNRDTPRAKAAEEVGRKIIEQQKNDVDAISGATTTSKALLKAIENALRKSLKQR